MLYLILIPLTVAGSAVLCAVFGELSFPHALAKAAIAACLVIAIDGILAFGIRRLPKRWFLADTLLFRVKERERRLYRRLGVCRWKDLVPELGALSGFRKNKLVSVSESEYLARFLLESNYGSAIHFISVIAGGLLFFAPHLPALFVTLPVVLCNALLNLMPLMILRYHTPPLTRLWKRSLRNGEPADAAQRSKQSIPQ